MSIQLKTGVYIYQNGKEGVGTTIDYQAVADYAKGLPEVQRVTLFSEPKKLNPLALADEFKKAGLGRIVIAGESPGSKLDKAQQSGVAILDEDDFYKLIGGE